MEVPPPPPPPPSWPAQLTSRLADMSLPAICRASVFSCCARFDAPSGRPPLESSTPPSPRPGPVPTHAMTPSTSLAKRGPWPAALLVAITTPLTRRGYGTPTSSALQIAPSSLPACLPAWAHVAQTRQDAHGHSCGAPSWRHHHVPPAAVRLLPVRSASARRDDGWQHSSSRHIHARPQRAMHEILRPLCCPASPKLAARFAFLPRPSAFRDREPFPCLSLPRVCRWSGSGLGLDLAAG